MNAVNISSFSFANGFSTSLLYHAIVIQLNPNLRSKQEHACKVTTMTAGIIVYLFILHI